MKYGKIPYLVPTFTLCHSDNLDNTIVASEMKDHVAEVVDRLFCFKEIK